MKFKNKKGELSTQQIVLLIILIASFAIILFFLFRLDPGNESEREACHQSVVMAGAPGLPSDSVPLKCNTKYLCITQDGTCEGLTRPEVEKVKTKEEIYDVLANEMLDCWWMFGEGKVNYVGKDMKENLYCSLCTQFILDDSLSEIIKAGSIDEKDFYEYLENKPLDGKEMTYLQYITGAGSVRDLEISMSGASGDFKKYDLGKQHYILMGIYSDVSVVGWVATGVGIAGAIVLMPFVPVASIGIASALILTTGGTVGYFAGTAVEGESGHDYLTPTIIEANSRGFSVFNCKKIVTSS